MISPIFEEISGKTEGVGFYKVDVDEQDAISHELGIRAVRCSFFIVRISTDSDWYT